MKTLSANGKPTSFAPALGSDKSFVTFSITQPGQFYICLNNDWPNSIHIFANPIQTNLPNKTDSNVLLLPPGTYANISLSYFPGKSILYLDVGQYFLVGSKGYIALGANEHLHMADGSFLYLSHYAEFSGIGLYGNYSTFTGRGVVDGSMQAGVCSVDGFSIYGNLLTIFTLTDLNQLLPGDNVSLANIPSPYSFLNSNSSLPYLTVLKTGLDSTQFQAIYPANMTAKVTGFYEAMATFNSPKDSIVAQNPFAVVDGFVLRDPSYFGVILGNTPYGYPIASNFKIFGSRLNTDGFHIDSANNAIVTNAFIRTYDDAACVNNNNQKLFTSNFSVSNIIIFKQKAHAINVQLGVNQTYNGHITNAYVIQDYSAESVGVIQVGTTETGTVGPNILLHNIYIDQCNSFLQLEINPNGYYSNSHQPGFVKGIQFTNISSSACSLTPLVFIQGFNATHIIKDITFTSIVVGGIPLNWSSVAFANPYYSNITINT